MTAPAINESAYSAIAMIARNARIINAVINFLRRKLITALMILAFLAIIAIALYALSLIAGAVILLLLSALLAYIIYPLVQLLHCRLLRSLSIAVAYLLVAVALAGGMFIVASALIGQSTSLVHS